MHKATTYLCPRRLGLWVIVRQCCLTASSVRPSLAAIQQSTASLYSPSHDLNHCSSRGSQRTRSPPTLVASLLHTPSSMSGSLLLSAPSERSLWPSPSPENGSLSFDVAQSVPSKRGPKSESSFGTRLHAMPTDCTRCLAREPQARQPSMGIFLEVGGEPKSYSF